VVLPPFPYAVFLYSQVFKCLLSGAKIYHDDTPSSQWNKSDENFVPFWFIADVTFKTASKITHLTDIQIALWFQVKVLKRPRFEISKLMELHGEGGGGKRGEAGDKSERPEGYEPPVQESV
jgi:small subunit ribosomal protein S3Ae